MLSCSEVISRSSRWPHADLVVRNERRKILNDVWMIERLEQINLSDAIGAGFRVHHVEDLSEDISTHGRTRVFHSCMTLQVPAATGREQ